MEKLGSKLKSRARPLTPALRRVAEFVEANRRETLTLSATELGARIGVSDATVVRAIQALGFTGMPELKEQIRASLGAGQSPADDFSRTMSEVSETSAAIAAVLRWQLEGLSRLGTPATLARIAVAVDVLAGAKAIAFFGLGPTAPLAHYAQTGFRRLGRRGIVLSAAGKALADQLLDLAAVDAVLMCAYGAPYPEAKTTIQEARRLGRPLVLLTDSLDEKLARLATVVVPVARGHPQRIALHAATMACLEAIMVGVATADRDPPLAALERLNDLRRELTDRR